MSLDQKEVKIIAPGLRTPMTKAPVPRTPVSKNTPKAPVPKAPVPKAPRPLSEKAMLAKRIEFERTQDHVPVKGQFLNYEVDGGEMKFSFKKYKGDATKHYTLTGGLYYELPLMVAKWLNTGGVVQEYEYKTAANGMPAMTLGHKRHRVGFQSFEFMPGMEDARKIDSIVIANPISNEIL